MIVANPIYDIVFKYLMEDNRIARTILSALLKKEVVEVHTRRNEYSNQQRDNLSVFRIDFGATIRQEDGTEQLILIELQKTWLETETLRFRQYLGAQYANKENMVRADRGEYALPMVAVYLLGHKVGDIEEPVIYVNHNIYDYDNRPVTKGIPDPFVNSLNHNSIIVQIPRLHGYINNRLDKVLSIFDQTRANRYDSQTLDLDESLFAGDAEMQPIIHRLVSAAADSELRHKMNVEDEFFSVIEKRDTEIMLRDRRLAEKSVQLAEKSKQLVEKSEQLAETSEQLAETSERLAETSERLEQAKTEAEQAKTEAEQAKAATSQMMRRSVLALLKSGMSIEAVAETMGLSTDMVRTITE